jgi:hypothetical protein
MHRYTKINPSNPVISYLTLQFLILRPATRLIAILDLRKFFTLCVEIKKEWVFAPRLPTYTQGVVFRYTTNPTFT